MIPGINLLNLALTVIAPLPVQWQQATGRTQNAVGQWVTAYAAPVTLSGSWQALDSATYRELGLDLAKTYFLFYVASAPVDAIGRGDSGDIIIRDGRRYHVESATNWQGIDGWRGLLCVDVGSAP